VHATIISSLRYNADCGTDQQLVWAKIKGKAWSQPSKWKKPARRDFANLHTLEGAVQFETKLKAKFEGNQPSWDALAEALTATAQECCAVTLYCQTNHGLMQNAGK